MTSSLYLFYQCCYIGVRGIKYRLLQLPKLTTRGSGGTAWTDNKTTLNQTKNGLFSGFCLGAWSGCSEGGTHAVSVVFDLSLQSSDSHLRNEKHHVTEGDLFNPFLTLLRLCWFMFVIFWSVSFWLWTLHFSSCFHVHVGSMVVLPPSGSVVPSDLWSRPADGRTPEAAETTGKLNLTQKNIWSIWGILSSGSSTSFSAVGGGLSAGSQQCGVQQYIHGGIWVSSGCQPDRSLTTLGYLASW